MAGHLVHAEGQVEAAVGDAAAIFHHRHRRLALGQQRTRRCVGSCVCWCARVIAHVCVEVYVGVWWCVEAYMCMHVCGCSSCRGCAHTHTH